MANVIEIIVQTIDKASGPLGSVEKSVSGLEARFGMLGKVMVSAFAGFTAASVFKKIVDESAAAESATKRLDIAFRNMGSGVGVARQEMDDFAKNIQATTQFSDESVQEMQAVMLRFDSITGTTFTRARTVIVDLAAMMGTDLPQAAQMVAVALEAPETGIRALRQAGVVLTEQQRDMIKAFEETGDRAKSQEVILAALESRTRGVAKELGDTLGGAIKRLNNAFGDLFEGSTGAVNPLTNAIKDLTKAISDPAFIAGFQTITKEAIKWAAAIVNVVGLVSKAATSAGEGVARLLYGPDTPEGVLQKRVEAAQAEFNTYSRGRVGTPEEIKAAADNLKKAKIALQDYRIELARAGGPNTKAPDVLTGTTQTDTQTGTSGTDTTTQTGAADTKDAWVDTWKSAQRAVDDYGKSLMDALSPETTGMDELRRVMKENDAAMDQLRKKQEQSAKVTDESFMESVAFAAEAARAIQASFANAFMNIGKGGLKGLVSDFANAFRQIIAQAAAMDLAKALNLTSIFGGGGGGSLGGLFGGVKKLFGFAGGGYAPSGMKIVGETGPELALTGPARFVNTRQLSFAGGGGMSYSPVTNVTINADRETDVSAIRREVMTVMEYRFEKERAEMNRTLYRNGFGRIR